MRIFSDAEGKFNLSALDINAGLLVISQFTLLADTRKGRRPSFTLAAQPDKAEALYKYFIKRHGERSGLKVANREFRCAYAGAYYSMMDLSPL